MKTIFGLLVTLLLLAQSAWAAALPPKDTAVAVMDFGTRPGATTSEINIHNAEYTSSEYVINQLVKRQYFVVKDKDMVMNKLKAEHLKTTGLIDQDTARRIGQMLGVRYIIYGNVVNVSVSDTGTEIMYNIGGGVNVCTVKAHMLGRMMDVETGDILMAVRGDGQSKSSFVKVHAGNNLLNTHVITIGTKKVTMDSVHNAIQKGAEQMVDSMISTLTGVPLSGKGAKKPDKKPVNKADKKK
jgi:curli biogenesis system outer membrane secretion channel CsgG